MKARGFTLVELIVAVAIVAVLAAIAWPSYIDTLRKGWRSEARAALVRLMQQQERGFTHEGHYRPFRGDSGEGGTVGRYAIDSAPCAGQQGVAQCIRLDATPRAGMADPQLKRLWIDSAGNRGCDGLPPAACWP